MRTEEMEKTYCGQYNELQSRSDQNAPSSNTSSNTVGRGRRRRGLRLQHRTLYPTRIHTGAAEVPTRSPATEVNSNIPILRTGKERQTVIPDGELMKSRAQVCEVGAGHQRNLGGEASAALNARLLYKTNPAVHSIATAKNMTNDRA